MNKKNIKSKRDAFAQHCVLDFAETEDYRYHYGLTTQPVWAFDDCYYCVTNESQRPAKHRDGSIWQWQEIKNDFINKDGWKIWKAPTE